MTNSNEQKTLRFTYKALAQSIVRALHAANIYNVDVYDTLTIADSILQDGLDTTPPVSPWLNADHYMTGDGVTEPGKYVWAIRALADAGRKIQAIKMLRQETGFGLKECKEAVERDERGRTAAW